MLLHSHRLYKICVKIQRYVDAMKISRCQSHCPFSPSKHGCIRLIVAIVTIVNTVVHRVCPFRKKLSREQFEGCIGRSVNRMVKGVDDQSSWWIFTIYGQMFRSPSLSSLSHIRLGFKDAAFSTRSRETRVETTAGAAPRRGQ